MGKKLSRLKFTVKQLVLKKYQEFRNQDNNITAGTPTSTGDIDYDLYLAASNDNVQHVERLLKMGANGLKPHGDRELTSLHVCISSKCVARIVSSLPLSTLNHLNDIRDDRGNTPIHSAAKSNRVDTLLCLIECGFDLNCQNNAGRTAARVAENHTWSDLSLLINQLNTGQCWCGGTEDNFDLEPICQMYLKIYSWKETCEDVWDFISIQKKEDFRDSFELEKKLRPLLKAQEERKRWANERKEAENKSGGKSEEGPNFDSVLANALKEMEKFDIEQKRRERAERAGIEYIPRNYDSSDDEDCGGSAPLKKGQKESLTKRISNLEKKITELKDQTRWRVINNSIGFPIDLQYAANDIVKQSLALHIRIGCPSREYVCKGCQKHIKLSNRDHHIKQVCYKTAVNECPQCKKQIKKVLLKNHIKNVCLAREWVTCPNIDDSCEFGEHFCGKEMKSRDLRKHMKLECQYRRKKCSHCKKILLFKNYNDHLVHECDDRMMKCVVDGCTRAFRKISEKEFLKRHMKNHLQKKINEWTSGDVSYWLNQTFPFFGDFLLLKYKKSILLHNIDGKKLKAYQKPNELRSKLLMKILKMPEDHAFTVCEAVVGRTPKEERWAENPKVVRLGAYLSRDVKEAVKRDRDQKYKVVVHRSDEMMYR
jgi:hypothetical protein